MEKNKMCKIELATVAEKLYGEVSDWKVVAERLKALGYRNYRGKAYSAAGVLALVNFGRYKNQKPRISPSTPTVKKELANDADSVIQLAKSILQSHGIEDRKKLDLLERVLGV